MPDVEMLQLDTAIMEKMWVPNAYFVYVQRVERPELLSDASGVTLYRNKTIVHSSLYLTRYTCYMNYKKYPMDTQRCNIRLQSWVDSAISFEVLLSRRVSNAVLTMYVPSTMLLIISWLSLWKAAWSVCRRWSGEEKADLLERTFRALLPAAFCVFNIAYWSYFLTTNDA
ncbi:Gamma-aminobutyric acid receptor subunit pi [Amphibalanus amphitrite]|uniref:Gamma-aminobutyric acid receptor subunit pi n=1 Tax=Amphibalanus amphitrite TaxID=1232801 RepID=A0A6A4V1H2_AMPAM|nr:Gamma-aminobutyric acid receptor subunit pi [Amphibalanus amphitrite]